VPLFCIAESEPVDTTEQDQSSSPVAEVLDDKKMEGDVEEATDVVINAPTDAGTELVTEITDSTTQEASAITDKSPGTTELEQAPAEVLSAEESVQIFAAILLEQLSM